MITGQVAYPYVAKRLLTDPNPALRERLIQVDVQYLLCFFGRDAKRLKYDAISFTLVHVH